MDQQLRWSMSLWPVTQKGRMRLALNAHDGCSWFLSDTRYAKGPTLFRHQKKLIGMVIGLGCAWNEETKMMYTKAYRKIKPLKH